MHSFKAFFLATISPFQHTHYTTSSFAPIHVQAELGQMVDMRTENSSNSEVLSLDSSHYREHGQVQGIQSGRHSEDSSFPVVCKTSLLDLPNELLIHIVHYLVPTPPHRRILVCLLLTHRRFTPICSPLLLQIALCFQFPWYRRTRPSDTVLHWASRRGHVNFVERLLDGGANVNGPSILLNRESPVLLASENGHFAVVELLVKHNARLNITDPTKETALTKAAKHGHNSVIRLLLDNGAKFSPKEHSTIHEAARRGFTYVVEWCLEKGEDVNSYVHNLGTPLHLAASRGHRDTIKLLISHGADPFIKNHCQRSAFDLVMMSWHAGVIAPEEEEPCVRALSRKLSWRKRLVWRTRFLRNIRYIYSTFSSPPDYSPQRELYGTVCAY
jgi:ankyrin repeat protein